MVFITGGTAQGKLRYVQETYGVLQAETADAAASASRLLRDADAWHHVRCVIYYQALIRQILAEGADPEEYTARLIDAHPDLIIVMEEIGCGIVPLEKEERIWREACGRCGCLIASRADQVIRLVCGIPTVLREDGSSGCGAVKDCRP